MHSRIAAFVLAGSTFALIWFATTPPAGAVPAPWVVDPPRPPASIELAKQIRDRVFPDEDKGRLLLPLLRFGMTTAQVEELLGEPDRKNWYCGPCYDYFDYQIFLCFNMHEGRLYRIRFGSETTLVAPEKP